MSTNDPDDDHTIEPAYKRCLQEMASYLVDNMIVNIDLQAELYSKYVLTRCQEEELDSIKVSEITWPNIFLTNVMPTLAQSSRTRLGEYPLRIT